jgi:hypothetical protein
MGDRTAQLKRLGVYKALLKDLDKWNYTAESLKRVPGYDPESLKKAAAFLELDHADPSHLLMLAHILADHVFGKRRPGRQKGVETVWDKSKKWELIERYDELRRQHPKLKETKIVDLICETPKFEKYDPKTIRVMLYEAMEFGLSDGADSLIWNAARKHVEDD